MPDRMYRVVVWSTGGVGSIAIGAVHGRRDLELACVWVHTPEKVRRDADELANGRPIGIGTTNNAGELIDFYPDCIVYAASRPGRDAAAVPGDLRLLEAGINVVTTTSTNLANPAAYDPPRREQQQTPSLKDPASAGIGQHEHAARTLISGPRGFCRRYRGQPRPDPRRHRRTRDRERSARGRLTGAALTRTTLSPQPDLSPSGVIEASPCT